MEIPDFALDRAHQIGRVTVVGENETRKEARQGRTQKGYKIQSELTNTDTGLC